MTTTLINANQCSNDVIQKSDIQYWYSNFYSNRYITLPCSGWYAGNWEIQVRIRLSSIPTRGTYIFSQKGVKSFELGIGINTGELLFYLDTTNSSGDSWTTNHNTGLILTANTDTFINVSYNGSSYITKISIDKGSNWSSDIFNYSNAVYSGGTNMIFGTSRDYMWYASTCNICTSDIYFKKDNELVYNGDQSMISLTGDVKQTILV